MWGWSSFLGISICERDSPNCVRARPTHNAARAYCALSLPQRPIRHTSRRARAHTSVSSASKFSSSSSDLFSTTLTAYLARPSTAALTTEKRPLRHTGNKQLGSAHRQSRWSRGQARGPSTKSCVRLRHRANVSGGGAAATAQRRRSTQRRRRRHRQRRGGGGRGTSDGGSSGGTHGQRHGLASQLPPHRQGVLPAASRPSA